jgi:L-ribulokinase
MFAATAAGIYSKVEDAMAAMGLGFETEYKPDPLRAALFSKRYHKYLMAGGFIEQLTNPKMSSDENVSENPAYGMLEEAVESTRG